jgi:hypothetical protein
MLRNRFGVLNSQANRSPKPCKGDRDDAQVHLSPSLHDSAFKRTVFEAPTPGLPTFSADKLNFWGRESALNLTKKEPGLLGTDVAGGRIYVGGTRFL